MEEGPESSGVGVVIKCEEDSEPEQNEEEEMAMSSFSTARGEEERDRERSPQSPSPTTTSHNHTNEHRRELIDVAGNSEMQPSSSQDLHNDNEGDFRLSSNSNDCGSIGNDLSMFDPAQQFGGGSIPNSVSMQNGLEPPNLTDVLRQLTGENDDEDKSSSLLLPQQHHQQFFVQGGGGAPTMVPPGGGIGMIPFNERLIQCSKCNFATCNRENMTRHMDTCPRIHPKFRGPEGRLQCDMCDYSTRRAFNLRRHIVSRNCAGRRVPQHSTGPMDLPVETGAGEEFRRVRRWPNAYKPKEEGEDPMNLLKIIPNGQFNGYQPLENSDEGPTPPNPLPPMETGESSSLGAEMGGAGVSPEEPLGLSSSFGSQYNPSESGQGVRISESPGRSVHGASLLSEDQPRLATASASVMETSDVIPIPILNTTTSAESHMQMLPVMSMPSTSQLPPTATASYGIADKFWSRQPKASTSIRRWKGSSGLKTPRRTHDSMLKQPYHLMGIQRQQQHQQSSSNSNISSRRFVLQDIVWQKAKEVFGGEDDTLQGLLETIACRLNERSFVQLNFESSRSLKMLQKWIAEDYQEKEKHT